jgi:hypothetical protein
MPYEPEHPVFKKPEDEGASLWRYMDFTKLMWMVEHAALFFARADLLGDPFEGSYSRANLALRPVWYGEEGVPEEIWKGLDAPRKHFLRSTFTNAWHMNNYESAAMWRLYLKTDEGIAIRSTFARLCESLKDAEPHVFVGLVNYLDYDLDAMPEGNTMWPFVCKAEKLRA